MAPMQYVVAWRMQKSLQLLTRADSKLSDVSLQFDYKTDAAFNRAFKRVIGVTPGQYRLRYSPGQNVVAATYASDHA